jgi:hypothetical protein
MRFWQGNAGKLVKKRGFRYRPESHIGTLGASTKSDSGHVMFLGIEYSYIVGDKYVGGIVGRMNYAEIQQVF